MSVSKSNNYCFTQISYLDTMHWMMDIWAVFCVKRVNRILSACKSYHKKMPWKYLVKKIHHEFTPRCVESYADIKWYVKHWTDYIVRWSTRSALVAVNPNGLGEVFVDIVGQRVRDKANRSKHDWMHDFKMVENALEKIAQWSDGFQIEKLCRDFVKSFTKAVMTACPEKISNAA